MAKPRKHRRKNSKRKVRCTICTTHRWMGNTAGRFKRKEEEARKRADEDIRAA